MYVLQSDNLKGLNSFTSPENIAPVTEEITISADQLEVELKPKSLNVIRVKIVE
jgi:alpha-L-arabinofuranosidase